MGELRESLKQPGAQVKAIEFDEMETFEITKCKPLSIPMVVEKGTRRILGFRVASMPAKGPLAKISLKKYGKRDDDRPKAAMELLEELVPCVSPTALIMSDQNPNYPKWIKSHFPSCSHTAIKGRDSCVVGQGELKKVGFDPIFSFNHTAAMLRANINRLFRKTWCTTKDAERLKAHIALYVQYHNEVLILEPSR